MTATSGSRLEEFTARPRRALWVMALPILVGMSIQTLYMIADMAFVGRVGPEALTALAFNMPLVFLGLGVTFGLGSGVTAVIAQAIGADDKIGADRAAEHALGLGLVLSAMFTGVAYGWGHQLLGLLGVPPELLPLAWDYFSVLAAGFVFLVFSVFFRSVLSGEGDMKTPMMIGGIGTLLNIALDPLLIFGLDMGVRGAALATVLCQALVAGIFVYMLLFKEHAYIRFDLGNFRFSGAILASICRIGLPASFSFVVIALGGAVFNRILVDYSGETVAAFQIGTRLDHVVMLPLIALAASLVTLVGMFHGAGRQDLARRVLRYAVLRGVAISAVLGAIFYAFAPQLAAVFSDNPEIRRIGAGYLRVVVFGYPFIAVTMLIGRALQGLGLGLPVLVLTLLRVLLISAPLAVWFSYGLDRSTDWVWAAIVIGNAIAAATALGWLRQGLRLAESARLAGLAEPAPVEAPLPT